MTDDATLERDVRPPGRGQARRDSSTGPDDPEQLIDVSSNQQREVPRTTAGVAG